MKLDVFISWQNWWKKTTAWKYWCDLCIV